MAGEKNKEGGDNFDSKLLLSPKIYSWHTLLYMYFTLLPNEQWLQVEKSQYDRIHKAKNKFNSKSENLKTWNYEYLNLFLNITKVPFSQYSERFFLQAIIFTALFNVRAVS